MTSKEIKELRNKLWLSQKQFAKQLGVSKRTIIRWESGRRTPDKEFQQKLLHLKTRVTDEKVTDNEVTNEKVTNGKVTDEKVTNEEVTNGKVTDKKVTNKKVTDYENDTNQTDSSALNNSEVDIKETLSSEVDNQDNQDIPIYTEFVKLTSLTEGDRLELQENRGFSKEVISELSFRSGRKEIVEPAIDTLKQKFLKEYLISSGVLVEKDEKDIIINPQLTKGHIIIPYLEVDGETVYRLRPHKLGFEGKGLDVYCRYLLKDKPEHVVLTEGEFKAAALRVLGIAAIAIPGVSSFSNQHFDDLVAFLREFEVKSVTILFDNEDKTNPDSPYYKENFFVRYDTQFWAFIMFYKLQKTGIESRIAQLPDSWRINGKADCDSALAAGHTKEQFIQVIDSAFDGYKYVEQLPEEAKAVVLRKRDRYFFASPLEIGFIANERNCYVWKSENTKADGKTEIQREVISNFHLEVDYTLFTSGDCLRKGVFVNKYDEKSEPFFITPKSMVQNAQFAEFCFAKGNYLWEGNAPQLREVWKHTFAHDTGALVFQPDGYGRTQINGAWLFGNCVISREGKVIQPDNDDIFWLESQRLGLTHPLPDTGEEGRRNVSFTAPIIETKNIVSIYETMEMFRQSIDTTGGFGAWLGVGWALASLFCDEIVKQYKKSFPLCFLAGKTGSGKTVFGHWLMSLVGGYQKEGRSVSQTTDKGLFRMLAKYSNLPVWLGDFRNTAPQHRIETLRNIYDRISYERAEYSNDYRTRSTPIRATLLVDGEETPRDPALLSRCVVILLSEKTRGGVELFHKIESLTPFLSSVVFQVLQKRNELLPEVIKRIRQFQPDILQLTGDDRLADNYSIIMAVMTTVLDTFVPNLSEDVGEAFVSWVYRDALKNREIKLNEDVINQFFEALNALTVEKEIRKEIHFIVEANKLYMWFYGCFAKYEEFERRRGYTVFKRSAIMEYILSEPYCVASNEQKWFSYLGKPQKCLVIDLDKAPDIVQTFAKIRDEGDFPSGLTP
jgi:DNA primase